MKFFKILIWIRCEYFLLLLLINFLIVFEEIVTVLRLFIIQCVL